MYVLWIKSFAYLKLGICWMLKISKNNRFAVETKINHTHQTPVVLAFKNKFVGEKERQNYQDDFCEQFVV